jgi:serine/threonine-protein kinase
MDALNRAGVGTRAFLEPTMGMGRTGTVGSPVPTPIPGMASSTAMPEAEATQALGSSGAHAAGSSGAHRAATATGPGTATGGRGTRAGGTAMTAGPVGHTGQGTVAPGVEGTVDLKPGGPRQGVFGRYEILEKLGRGAVGDVFKVKDPRIGRVAALKTIRVDVDLSPQQVIEMRQRFYREAQTAGKLTHPNIVTIYDVGEEQGISFIVMEFVEGSTLTSLLKKGKPLSVAQVKHLIIQAAAGLDYAHQNGVFHRDVKPDNIMVSKTGVVKVMDFGIARIAESEMTRTGSVLGTPAYMSPEQFSGKKVDGRSDIFSLGVVLYELLTRRRPFGGDTATAIMFEILQKEPLPPSQVDAGVSAEWDAVVGKALTKNIDERYQSATDLANAVRAVTAK